MNETAQKLALDWKTNWHLNEENEQRKECLFVITNQALESGMADEVLDLIIKDENPEIRESSFEFIRGIELLTNLIYLKKSKKLSEETVINVSSNFGVNGDVAAFMDWLNIENNNQKINTLLAKYVGWQIFQKNMENPKATILPVPIDLEKFFTLNIEDRNSMTYYSLNNLLNKDLERDAHAIDYWMNEYAVFNSEYAIFKTSTHFYLKNINKKDYKNLTDYVLNSKEEVDNNDIQNSLNTFWKQEIEQIFTKEELNKFVIVPPMGFQNTIEYAVQQQIFAERARHHNIEAMNSQNLNLMPNIQKYQVEVLQEKIAINIETFDGNEQVSIPNNISILTHLTPDDFKKNIHQSLIKPEVLMMQANQENDSNYQPPIKKPTLH